MSTERRTGRELVLLRNGRGRRHPYVRVHGERLTTEAPRRRVGVHIHTSHSDGVSEPERTVETAVRSGLQEIHITDHDLISGAERAREFAITSGAPVDVHVGIEGTVLVKDPDGKERDVHAIGLDVTEPIACYMSLAEFNAEVHRQGGTTLLPHFGLRGLSPTLYDIHQLYESRNDETHFDLIEIYSAASANNRKWRRVPGVRRHLLNGNANQLAAGLYRAHPEYFHGVVGATDIHTGDKLDDVVNEVDDAAVFTEAAKAGELVVYRRFPLHMPNVRETLNVQRRSAQLEVDRQDPHRAAARGISLYDPSVPARKTA